MSAGQPGLWPWAICPCGSRDPVVEVQRLEVADAAHVGRFDETPAGSMEVQVPLCQACVEALEARGDRAKAARSVVEAALGVRWDQHARPHALQLLSRAGLNQVQARMVMPAWEHMRVVWRERWAIRSQA